MTVRIVYPHYQNTFSNALNAESGPAIGAEEIGFEERNKSLEKDQSDCCFDAGSQMMPSIGYPNQMLRDMEARDWFSFEQFAMSSRKKLFQYHSCHSSTRL